MQKEKLKVLMCSEASFIKSGFGVYAKEILSRLHKTGKYTIAEFASYGFVNDPRDKEIDWIYYANAVKTEDPRYAEYMSRGDNQFGRWRFEKVVLDFKPDVVIDVRDYWMTAYQKISPVRKYFHWVLMPTVDSKPQQEEWIETFLDADAIFTYSDWGAEVLKYQTSSRINYIDTASPGVDLDTFNIQDKNQIRQKFNLPTDAFVIGSVMRNQKRKLIPELFSSFRKLLDILETKDYASGARTFLYLHTSYPDAGWDIPELLKEYRLSNKVLFSYICRNCQNLECSVFQSPNKICKQCFQKTSFLPSVTHGVSTVQLSQIYNNFDLYVQYAICEGFGMPQVEAGACGIPVITIDYSAMCDIIDKLGAMKVRTQTLFTELETKALRAYPNNDDMIKHVLDFMNLPISIQNKKKIETRIATEKNYNWDIIAQKWEKYLDNLDLSQQKYKWNSRSEILESIIDKKPIDQSNYFNSLFEIVSNKLHDSDNIGSLKYLELLKNADYGFVQNVTSIQPYKFTDIYEHINILIDNNNRATSVREENISFDTEDFIRYAKIKQLQ